MRKQTQFLGPSKQAIDISAGPVFFERLRTALMQCELWIIYSIFNVNHTKCCKVDKCKNYMTKGMNKFGNSDRYVGIVYPVKISHSEKFQIDERNKSMDQNKKVDQTSRHNVEFFIHSIVSRDQYFSIYFGNNLYLYVI